MPIRIGGRRVTGGIKLGNLLRRKLPITAAAKRPSTARFSPVFQSPSMLATGGGVKMGWPRIRRKPRCWVEVARCPACSSVSAARTGNGAPCVRITHPAATPGNIFRTTTRAAAHIAGAKTASPVSATTRSISAYRWPCGMAAIRF